MRGLKGWLRDLGLPIVLVSAAGLLVAAVIVLRAQAPTAFSDTYPLTFERNDFTGIAAGQTTFQTRIQARGKFVLVFRNGLIQIPCPSVGAPLCDYTVSGNVTITYPANIIQAADTITLLFYG
jgi:hypothetical protein